MKKITRLDADVIPAASSVKSDDTYFAFLEWYKQAWGGGGKTPNEKKNYVKKWKRIMENLIRKHLE